ncbi:MAG: heavy-metal-associated domain-containing protein [Chloroflexota bacterium]
MNWFHKPGEVQALEVEGIRCSHCEATIKIAVRSLPGVRSVSIRRNKQVAVEIAPGQTVQRADLIAAIEKHGYKVLESSDAKH